MPGYLGLQLSFELGQIPLIKNFIDAGVRQVWSLARNLRNSGSDLSVERDLAEMFGRGMIQYNLERKFTDTVTIRHVVPLSGCPELELESGPGPTVLRALRESDYKATVIQLSFLCWTHNREQLADMIVSSMRKRSELGLGNGIGDPSAYDIVKTLTACSSQTANFNWSLYIENVEEKLKAGIPTYQYSADYIRITPALLLGAIDCLYRVQRFEEERKIAVTNEIGSISLIVWAHYILGLNISVTGNVSNPIIFGNGSKPHVVIDWTQPNRDFAGELFYPNSSEECGPELHLLDSNTQVVLRCIPDETDRLDIIAEDRHPLLGWGRTYLRRLLNTSRLTVDQDPIYEEITNLVTGLAITASKRLDRDMSPSKRRRASVVVSGDLSSVQSLSPVDLTLPPLTLNYGRIFDAAVLIFDGIHLDKRRVLSYASHFDEKALNADTCPTTFNAFLENVETDYIEVSPSERLLDQVKYLARFVLIFSYVVDLQECSHVPLRMTDDSTHMASQMEWICASPHNRAMIGPSQIFHALAIYLSGYGFNHEDDTAGLAGRSTRFLFLYSDFGWSIFFDTLGHKDPADVNPELVHLKPGTPTNVRTGERKTLLRDGTGVPKSIPPDSFPLSEDTLKMPRCMATTVNRSVFWSARRDEFQATLYSTFQPSSEWCERLRGPVFSSISDWQALNGLVIEEVSGYRDMQEQLWRCYVTPQRCRHSKSAESIEPLSTGPDAVALMGWYTWTSHIQNTAPQRILILLTRGDRDLRWCALLRNLQPSLGDRNPDRRKVMLRRPNFCDECALNHVARQPGNWILIL